MWGIVYIVAFVYEKGKGCSFTAIGNDVYYRISIVVL